MLTSAGAVGEAGTLLLETVGRLLEDALANIGAVTEARARSDGMDLGIAWTAHELRGPLVGARASIDRLIARDGHGSSSDLLRDTRDELERLASLVDPLLRWAAGSGELRPRRTDLVKIVRDAIASCELAEDRSRIALLAPSALEMRADPKQLRTAVANLVRNAIAYSPEGARVTVEIGRTGSAAWVCVRDRGPGVPPDEHDLIFDPFARGAVGAGSRRGAGLGLFIARRVVEAHGGNVRVLSSRRGAAFCIELPVAEGGRVRSAS
jgi:signal transduction histidine kinase